MRLLVPLTAALLAVGLAAGTAAPAQAAPAAPPRGDTQVTTLRMTVDGVGAGRTTVVGSGGAVRFTAGLGWRYWGERPSAPRIVLQWFRGGTWRTAPTASVRPATDPARDRFVAVTRPLSAGRAVDRIRFRLLSAPYRDATGAVTNRVVSAPMTVAVEDQSAYTGLRALIWHDLQAFCPGTAVRVRPLDDAAGQYRTGRLLIEVDPAVARDRGIDSRAVALHECAHERQWLNYGATSAGWAAMKRAAQRIYRDDRPPADAPLPYPYRPSSGFVPLEHGADCAAQALNPGGYLGYDGWCDPRELREGRRLLLGHRY